MLHGKFNLDVDNKESDCKKAIHSPIALQLYNEQMQLFGSLPLSDEDVINDSIFYFRKVYRAKFEKEMWIIKCKTASMVFENFLQKTLKYCERNEWKKALQQVINYISTIIDKRLDTHKTYDRYVLAILFEVYILICMDNIVQCERILQDAQERICFLAFNRMDLLQLINALKMINFDSINSQMQDSQGLENESVDMTNQNKSA